MSLAKRRPERPPTKLDVQLDLIVSAFREKGIDIGVALFPGGGLDFIYQRGVILVRDAYLGQVRDIVGGGGTGDGFRGGVTLYSLAHAKIRDAIEALAEIDRSLGIGVATPNHILSITPVWPCPATEPAGECGYRRTPAAEPSSPAWPAAWHRSRQCTAPATSTPLVRFPSMRSSNDSMRHWAWARTSSACRTARRTARIFRC